MQSAGNQQGLGQPYAWNLYSAGLDATITADLGTWPIGINRGALEIFAHRAQFALSGMHLLYAPGDRFEVRRYDEAGRLNRISRTERSRQAVTQEHIDAFWVNLRASTAGRANQDALLRRVGEPLFADSMPGYTSILATEDLGFWARQATAPNDSIDVWDIHDERGIYLGSVRLPPRFIARDVSDRYVVGTTRDSNDVEFVETYEWTWPGRTGEATSGVHSR